MTDYNEFFKNIDKLREISEVNKQDRLKKEYQKHHSQALEHIKMYLENAANAGDFSTLITFENGFIKNYLNVIQDIIEELKTYGYNVSDLKASEFSSSFKISW